MARRRRGAPVDPAPCFRRGFLACALASAGPWRQINDADIRSVTSKTAPTTTFIVLYRPLSAFADAFGGGA
jgi:hypothetical protein